MNFNKLNAKKVFSLIQQQKLNQNAVKTVFKYLKLLLSKLDGKEYIYWLKYLAKLISLGYGSFIKKDQILLNRLVIMFNQSFKYFTLDSNQKSFSYTIFQISVIADLIRSFPLAMYPYNKEFVQNTIKLSEFTDYIKETREKLILVICILYLNFTESFQLYQSQSLVNELKKNLFFQIQKAQKQHNRQAYELICKAFDNIVKSKSSKSQSNNILLKQKFQTHENRNKQQKKYIGPY